MSEAERAEAERAAGEAVVEMVHEAREQGVPEGEVFDYVFAELDRRRDRMLKTARMLNTAKTVVALVFAPRQQMTCRRPRSRSIRIRARSPGRPSGDDDPHEHARADVTRRIAAELRAATTCPRCAAGTVALGLVRTCPAYEVEVFCELWERRS